MSEPPPTPPAPTPFGAPDDAFKDHVESLLRRLEAHRSTSSRYEELRDIASGGMGVVVEVRDQDLRRKLALKRMHPKRMASLDGTQNRQFLARFLQEAQVTGQLGHPGIPPIHELGIDHEGRAYFTMPYISGSTLSRVFDLSRSRQAGWDLRKVIGVLIKVCEAMSYAHAKRVIHRDLKPANIMVGMFGETYVMDWGLARILDAPDLFDMRIRTEADGSSIATDRRSALDHSAEAPLRTMDDTVLGTPSYMPPEQALGEISRIGPHSDIYAVGAMLYHLLSGQVPYQVHSTPLAPKTVLDLVQHGPPTPLAHLAPDLEPDLVAICEKAMSRRPEDRYASMQALAEDLAAWTGKRPTRANPPDLRRSMGLFVQRNKASTATAALGLLALIVASIAFVVRVSRESSAKDIALAEARRRGDTLLSKALLARESELWPADAATVPAMSDWLAQLDDLMSRCASYREQVEQGQAGDQARGEMLSILASIHSLEAQRSRVSSRMEMALSLRRETIEQARAEWDAARDRMARQAAYASLKLEPQVGLFPLGPDPESGFEEFWLVASGTRPNSRKASATDIHAGIVLVLLPGGLFSMGSPPGGPFTLGSQFQKPPALEVPHLERVGPFFLSKYETTQAQWFSVMDFNPSRTQEFTYVDQPAGSWFPVEGVNWDSCQRFCDRLGVELPTQAQWEYAARAGCFEDYGYGPTLSSVEGYENVSDLSRGRIPGNAHWNDGFRVAAPVGSYCPNAFGLHDMLGNVTEWCQDEFNPSSPVNVGQPEYKTRAFRGGGYMLPNTALRPALVQWDVPTGANHTRGLRVARRIQ